MRGKVVIIGAGPAGMACAHALAKRSRPALVIEQDRQVGGLCRTINFHGFLFDIGGHRFISKSGLINKLWKDIMGDRMLKVKRMSRIYYRKKFFNYPLSFFNTFWNLGIVESARSVASYATAKLTRPGDDDTFEGWIINRFGKRLYEIFFDTYTRKVWEVPCWQLSADWATQRIKGLSLRVAIRQAVLGANASGPKTLYQEFSYPERGPGEFYTKLQGLSKEIGTHFLLSKRVAAVDHDGEKIVSVRVKDSQSGECKDIAVRFLFSSMPLPLFIKSLHPEPEKEVLRAAENLRFRSILCVNLILNKAYLFPDQWIYIHSPEVKVGRIQNFKNWSPFMVPSNKYTSLGLEYFCTERDNLWSMNDFDLIDYAAEELETLGISSRRSLVNGFVIRRANAYPLYALDYRKNLGIIRQYLRRFSNIQKIGRAGLFRYDNSDLAMLTGMAAADNFVGEGSTDIWDFGQQDEYLES